MPYRILCNGTEQKSLEANLELALKPSRFSPLHKFGMASGKGSEMKLRLYPTKNNQEKNVNWAKDYEL